MKLLRASIVVLSAFLSFSSSFAAEVAITKVGNGDAGGDLENVREVADGRLVQTRDLAIQRLKRLHSEGVEGLGNLLPELQSSQILLSTQAVAATLLQDAPAHRSSAGQVYARTFAESHAATRFFPEALRLSGEQLEALHIHEALHRSLPAGYRESESVVSEITLAIASPDASHDRLRSVTSRMLAISPDMLAADEIRAKQAAPTEVSITSKLVGVDDENWVMEKPNLFLVEGAGKGFFYSVGYERQLTSRFSLGVGFSYLKTDPKPVTQPDALGLGAWLSEGMADLFSYAALPLYVHYAFATGRHRPFAELGVTTIYFHRAHQWGAFPGLGAGYEFRTQIGFFLRASGYLVVALPPGDASVRLPVIAPTAGITLGWAF